MDCNKDEAVRAKEMAEKKMEKNDFEAARKIAKKAQTIYPELENISQLLAVCDVHCSALKRVLGLEKDWYEILQVESLADEATVKKQYRRLALFLHPDKNRFPGAEAAFKLICEANAVLSNPEKKSLYDSRIRASTRCTPVYKPIHNFNKNPLYNNFPQCSVSNGFSSLNLQQAVGSSSSLRQEGFWTSCPFCDSRFQYERKFVNISIRCQNCLKMFMACEISSQSTSIGSKGRQHGSQQMPPNPGFTKFAAFQERVQNHGNIKKGVKKGTAVPDSPGYASRNTVQQDQGIQIGVDPRYSQSSAAFNGGQATRVARNSKNKGRRGRKQVVESSESLCSSTESDIEDVSTGTNGNELNSGNDNEHMPRRSTRKRQRVAYNESDDDFASLPMGSQARNPGDSYKKRKVDLGGEDSVHDNQNSFSTDADISMSKGEQTGTVHPEGSFQDKGTDHDKEVKVRRETDGGQRFDADTIEITSDSDQDFCSNDNPNVGTYDCPDPEFNDFDKERDESCFKINQVWACYDSFDGMPRFYAKVKQVHRSPFELSFAWLEAADPNDAAWGKSVDEGLSDGCGNFMLGKTEKTSSCLTFSHQMVTGKGEKRGSLSIYPREGETWAIFKDCGISPGSNSGNGAMKYELVEVLSDFDTDVGIKVVYLDKILDFVSLFQRTSQNETDFFLIRPNELCKFSHRVPCFKMTGSEKEGVPRDSFEIEPAALPLNPENLFYPSKAKMEDGNLGSVNNGQESQQENGKSTVP